MTTETIREGIGQTLERVSTAQPRDEPGAPWPKRVGGRSWSVEHATLIVLGGVLACVVGVALWASTRGFDFTDEGIYLLSLERPRAAHLGFTQFHSVMDLVLGPIDLDVRGFRLLRLVMVGGSSALFGYGLVRLLEARVFSIRAHLPRRSVAILFTTIMGLMGYTWLPQTLSYNGVNATLLNCEAALAFLLWAGPPATRQGRSRWRSALLGTVMGSLLALHFFVKAPATMGFLLIFVGLSWLLSGWRPAIRGLGWTMFGAVVTLTVTVQELLGTKLSLVDLRDGLLTDAAEQHKPRFLWTYYKDTTRESYERAFVGSPGRVVALTAILLTPVLARLALRHFPRTRLGVTWVAALGGGWWVLAEASRLRGVRSQYFSRGWNHDFLVSLFFAAVITAVAVGAVVRGRSLIRRARRSGGSKAPDCPASQCDTDLPRADRHEGWIVGSLLLCLFVLPFVAAVGTLNSLLLQSTTAAAGFGGVVVIGVALLRRHVAPSSAGGVLQFMPMALIALVIAIQILQGMVFDPYRVLTPLTDQTEAVTGVPNLRGIKVDVATHRYLQELYRASRQEAGMTSSDLVLALSHMPGAVFALDGVAPGPVIINYPTSGFQLVDCTQLEKKSEDVRRTSVMLRNSPLTTEMRACLDRIRPSFETAFVLVARIKNPLALLGPYDEYLEMFVMLPREPPEG